MYPNHEEWLNRVASGSELVRKLGDLRISAADHPQDESTLKLKDLKELGYSQVEWHSGTGSCDKCRAHDLHTWSIDDFLSNLKHNAPVFERSHVGCRSCHLICTGPDLEQIQVGPYPF